MIWSICGWMVGSPPAMETMGAPDSATAWRATSTGIILSSTGLYSRIRPQPTQARLHISKGSSMVTSGNRFLPRSRFRSRYQANRTESSIGRLAGFRDFSVSFFTLCKRLRANSATC